MQPMPKTLFAVALAACLAGDASIDARCPAAEPTPPAGFEPLFRELAPEVSARIDVTP